MSDARISTSLPGHHKTKRLIKRLGPASGWYLVRLFLWAASNKPNGDLSGMSAEDIELAIDWDGDEGALVTTLAQVRFLDGEPGAYRIHDWADHNPWVNGSDLRAAKARWNAIKRHHGIREADRLVPEWAARRHTDNEAMPNASSNADSNADSSATINAGSNADAAPSGADSIAPSPSPSPNPSPSPSPYPPPSPQEQERVYVGDVEEETKTEGIGEAEPSPDITPVSICIDLQQLGVAGINPSYAPLHEAIREGVSRTGFLAAAKAAIEKGKGRLDYIVGKARGQFQDKKSDDTTRNTKQAAVEQKNSAVASSWAQQGYDRGNDHAAV